MPRNEDVMRFPDITHAIQTTYDGETQFLCENLDKAVAKAASACYRNGVKTKLTVEISMERGKGDELILRADLKTKIPNPKAFPITAFVDRDGTLVKDDPRQAELPGIHVLRSEG